MKITKLQDHFRTLLQRLHQGVRDLPELLRRPGSLYRWMVRNPRVPLAALAVLVAVPLVLPVADYLLEKIYQPVVQKELFGLINTVHEDERLGARQAQVRWLLWVCALAGSISILLLQIPLARSEIADRDDDPEEAGSYKDATLVEEPIVRCVGPGDRYRFEAEVGRGAMGIVYQARDTVLDRDVAVKELPEHLASDPEKNERFRGEARALANLTHPGVVQVYDLLDHERRTYLVMEFVKGGNLQELFDRSGQIPLNRACGFGLSIAQALAYVHETGIVHRDLKPSNILLTEEGLPKITDFGVARWTNESSLTADGAIIGSPNYMSPEQAAGKVADQRSDLYSFGVLLYWLITGTTPYSGDALAILSQHMTGTPRPPSAENKSISEEMDKAVLSLMEKDPGAREHGLKKAIAVLTAEARG